MTEAMRSNDGKPRHDLFLAFGDAITAVSDVLGQGAVKYEEDNWLLGGKPDGEYLASAMRHMLAFRSGEVYDQDIGTMHIANAAWNMLALIRLNYPGVPTIDPDFDQAAFLAKYQGEPEPEAEQDTAKYFRIGDEIVGESPYDGRVAGRVLVVDPADEELTYGLESGKWVSWHSARLAK